MRWRLVLGAVSVVGLVAAGCSDDSDDADEATTTTEEAVTTSAAEATEETTVADDDTELAVFVWEDDNLHDWVTDDEMADAIADLVPG